MDREESQVSLLFHPWNSYNLTLRDIQPARNLSNTLEKKMQEGIGFGCALAMAVSFVTNKSILWACLHGLMSWAYVLYYILVTA